MTSEETMIAFDKELPVIFRSPIYGDISYKRIEQVIYHKKNGMTVVSCSLLDYNGRSVTVVQMEEVHAETRRHME